MNDQPCLQKDASKEILIFSSEDDLESLPFIKHFLVGYIFEKLSHLVMK